MGSCKLAPVTEEGRFGHGFPCIRVVWVVEAGLCCQRMGRAEMGFAEQPGEKEQPKALEGPCVCTHQRHCYEMFWKAAFSLRVISLNALVRKTWCNCPSA